MKEDRDQTSCSPHDTDSHSVSHYHSDLNSIFTVCFSPEGSIHRGRDKQIAHWCRLCHMQISHAQLFFFSLSISIKTSIWSLDWCRLLIVFLDVFLNIIFDRKSEEVKKFFFSGFISASLSLQGAAQIAPCRHCQLAPKRLWLLVLEFSGLEGANLIDFHLQFFFLPSLSLLYLPVPWQSGDLSGQWVYWLAVS